MADKPSRGPRSPLSGAPFSGDGPPPDESAKEHLKEGLGHMWRAAREAARFVQREAGTLRRDVSRTSVSRTLDDAGREVARAANNVADRLGEEIGSLEQSARRAMGDLTGNPVSPSQGERKRTKGRSYPATEGLHGDPADVPPPANAQDWPKNRDEYELRYGPASAPKASAPEGSAPRAPEPKPGPTGLRIATDDDDR